MPNVTHCHKHSNKPVCTTQFSSLPDTKRQHLPTIELIYSFLYLVISPDYTPVTSGRFQKCSSPRKDNHRLVPKRETSANADRVA